MTAEGGGRIITLRERRQDVAGFWKVSSLEADVHVPARDTNTMTVEFRSSAHA